MADVLAVDDDVGAVGELVAQPGGDRVDVGHLARLLVATVARRGRGPHDMRARRVRVGRGGLRHLPDGVLDLTLDGGIDRSGLCVHAVLREALAQEEDRVGFRRQLLVGRRAVVLDVAVVVAPETVAAAFDEGRPLAVASTLCRGRHGGLDREGIATVDRDRLDAHRLRPGGQALGSDDPVRGRELRPAVVLADQHDRKPAVGGEHQALVQRALTGGAVAEADDGDAAAVGDLGGEGPLRPRSERLRRRSSSRR